MRKLVEVAADGVIEGLHKVRSLCWECDSPRAGKDLLICSQCRVCGYCSHDCQKAHWKGGHKKSCKEVARRNKLLMNALDYADHVNAEGEIHGIYVDPSQGYFMASKFADPNLFEPWMKELGVDGPKMEYLYKNWAAILSSVGSGGYSQTHLQRKLI